LEVRFAHIKGSAARIHDNKNNGIKNGQDNKNNDQNNISNNIDSNKTPNHRFPSLENNPKGIKSTQNNRSRETNDQKKDHKNSKPITDASTCCSGPSPSDESFNPSIDTQDSTNSCSDTSITSTQSNTAQDRKIPPNHFSQQKSKKQSKSDNSDLSRGSISNSIDTIPSTPTQEFEFTRELFLDMQQRLQHQQVVLDTLLAFQKSNNSTRKVKNDDKNVRNRSVDSESPISSVTSFDEQCSE
jgi:hypothetical protein